MILFHDLYAQAPYGIPASLIGYRDHKMIVPRIDVGWYFNLLHRLISLLTGWYIIRLDKQKRFYRYFFRLQITFFKLGAMTVMIKVMVNIYAIGTQFDVVTEFRFK